MTNEMVRSEAPASGKVFTSYDVQMCLFDERRTELFRQAVDAAVQPGDVVIDCGSGTGVLGMFAALAGARRVYCVEMSSEYVEIIEENARRNGLDDRIIVVQADATTYRPPEPVDVIVAEVLSAGFFYEPQIQIMNNMRRYLKPGGRVVPEFVENRVELIEAQKTMYGLRFDYEPRWKALPDDRALTDVVAYLETDFAVADPAELEDTSEVVDVQVQVRGIDSGAANAIRVTYKLRLTEKIESAEATEFLLNPQIIFLDRPITVAAGEPVRLSLRYDTSGSPRDCVVRQVAEPSLDRVKDRDTRVRASV